jgi:hypothetical protein
MAATAGLARSPEHVHRHLFVMRAFLGEQHRNRPDIRTAVKTVEDDPSHYIPFAGFRATAVSGGAAVALLPAFAYLSSARGSSL